MKDIIENNEGPENKLRIQAQKEINKCLQGKINQMEEEKAELINRLKES